MHFGVVPVLVGVVKPCEFSVGPLDVALSVIFGDSESLEGFSESGVLENLLFEQDLKRAARLKLVASGGTRHFFAEFNNPRVEECANALSYVSRLFLLCSLKGVNFFYFEVR